MVTVANQIDQGTHTFPRAVVAWSTVPFVLYLLTAALAHNLLSRKRTAFLDICCVNQLDPVAKAQGIERLGAVLARTESMLVLADEHYWRRLWCIFEVAAFCRHADPARLVILPLHSSLTELGVVLFWFVLFALLILSRMQQETGVAAGGDAAAGAVTRAYFFFLSSIVLLVQVCACAPPSRSAHSTPHSTPSSALFCLTAVCMCMPTAVPRPAHDDGAPLAEGAAVVTRV